MPALRDALADDGAALAEIYNPYILGTTITFEEQPVTGEEMARRVGDVQGAGFPWLVAEEGGGILGYACASTWRTRIAYRHCAEVAVYLRPQAMRRGLATALYRELLDRLGRGGIHVALACIALPNEPSVALHEKLGLRKVAHFAEVGRKFGRWVDVGYWQIVLPFPPTAGAG